jgi:pimeloyl-ACP methyl ester carboxylesterase
MKKVVILAFWLLRSVVSMAQNEPPNYATAIADFKQYFNNNQPQYLYAKFGDEMKKALSPEKWDATTSQLKTQLGPLTETRFEKLEGVVAYYKATFEKAPITLSISLNNAGQITGLLLRPYAGPVQASTIPADPSVTEAPISLKTLAGTISGTLAMPKHAEGKIPVVLIIAGSGPTDRDGNSTAGLNTNMYKMLAVALAKNGIASVRYDKRMVGKSVSAADKESELRFEDYVEDAISLEKMLAADDRFSKIIVFGHSEGSLVGMLSSIDEPVKGFISAAGAGDSADKILTEQMKTKPPYIVDGFKRVLDSLRRGRIYKDVDPGLYFIARPSIQKYLMSWCRYNPKLEIKKLKIPILILQGTTDIQVSVGQAEMLKKAKSEASLVIITGMSHILKEGPEDKEKNEATYNNPDLPLKPEMVTAVLDFIKKV